MLQILFEVDLEMQQDLVSYKFWLSLNSDDILNLERGRVEKLSKTHSQRDEARLIFDDTICFCI